MRHRPWRSSAGCAAARDVARAELRERGGEPVAGVALGVVAHDGLRGTAALLDEPARCAAQGAENGGDVSAGVDLAVGQPGVIAMTPMTLTLPACRVRWRSPRSPWAQCPGPRTSAAQSRRCAARPIRAEVRTGARPRLLSAAQRVLGPVARVAVERLSYRDGVHRPPIQSHERRAAARAYRHRDSACRPWRHPRNR
jgi:hypothetical protein